MVTDTVNTMTFDFTCTSEAIAKRMSAEFIHYKASRFNSVLSQVLSEKMDNTQFWKINTIEIDLGNIRVEDIASDSMVHKFRDILIENLEQILHTATRPSDANVITLPEAKARIDIVKEFLLYGDVPWWINKNDFSKIDKTIKAAIRENKEELGAFLYEQKNNADLLRRIQLYFSAATLSQLYRLFPKATHLNTPAQGGNEVNLASLPAQYLQKMSTPVNERLTAENKNVKQLLIQSLLRNISSPLAGAAWISGALRDTGTERLKLFFSDKPVYKTTAENAYPVLQKLNIFQLELLSLAVSRGGQPGSPHKESPGDRSFENETERKHRAIVYIGNVLKTKDKVLHDELYKASVQEVLDLQKLFCGYKKHEHIKQRMINLIIEHPYFLRYKLPELLANLSFDFPVQAGSAGYTNTGKAKTSAVFKEIARSQIALRKLIGGLTPKQSLIFSEVFATGAFPSSLAKKTISAVLGKLPDRCLNHMAWLTSLDKKTIEHVVSVTFARGETTAGARKIVVENAGLCLLAPYLPALFNALGYIRQGKFITTAAAHRALYVLQYMVNGRQQNYEYVLQLNKLLCGIRTDEPITRYKRLTRMEKTEADDLVLSVINNWKALKSTSKEGFRTSFLQRKGLLAEEENAWSLQVEKTAYDLLLDSIPWAFNIIKLPWMKKMIRVEW